LISFFYFLSVYTFYMVYSFIHGIFLYTWYIPLYMVYSFIHGIFLYTWYIPLYMVYFFIHGIFLYTWYISLYMVYSFIHDECPINGLYRPSKVVPSSLRKQAGYKEFYVCVRDFTTAQSDFDQKASVAYTKLLCLNWRRSVSRSRVDRLQY